MQNDDIATGIGGACSVILTFFAWLWNIPILQFAFTFILGSLVTYFIQRRLQDRSEKRKLTRKNIEKIYGPLYVGLQECKKSLIDELAVPKYENGRYSKTSIPYWIKVRTFPEFFSIPLKLREEMDEITEKEHSIINSLDEIKRIADSYLIEATESALKDNLETSGEVLYKESSDQNLYISARSGTGAHYYPCFLHDCLLLNENPVERIKRKLPGFSSDHSELNIMVTRKGQQTSPQNKYIGLTNIQTELQQIFEKARIKAREDRIISRVLKEKEELSQRIDKLLLTMEKYIAKNYPIENV